LRWHAGCGRCFNKHERQRRREAGIVATVLCL
jgi:hypothetical protein